MKNTLLFALALGMSLVFNPAYAGGKKEQMVNGHNCLERGVICMTIAKKGVTWQKLSEVFIDDLDWFMKVNGVHNFKLSDIVPYGATYIMKIVKPTAEYEAGIKLLAAQATRGR